MGVILVLHGECSKDRYPVPPCEALVPGKEKPRTMNNGLKINAAADKSQAFSLFHSINMLIPNGKLKIMPTVSEIRC